MSPHLSGRNVLAGGGRGRQRPSNLRDERGQVLPIAAICMVFVIMGAAFGVDLGSLMAQKRKLQSVADLVALDVVRSLNGGACNAGSPALVDSFNAAAVASADRNKFPIGGTNVLTVEPGLWNAATSTFDSFGPNCTSNPSGVPTGVRITAKGTTTYGFARVVGINSQDVDRAAVASQTGRATWMLGSSLADVNTTNSALLNPVMNGLLGTGSSINTSLVSYQGLANSSISLADLATELGLGVGGTDNILNTSVGMRNFLNAVATVLGNDGNSSAAATVAGLAAAVSATSTLQTNLGNLIKLGSGVNGSTADAQLNVFQLITGAAGVATGRAFIDIPGLTINPVPGVASVTVRLSAIQPQVICVMCAVGESKSTAQVTLTVTPTIQPVNLLGLSQVVSVSGQVPITVTAGGATGTTGAIQCGSSTPGFTVISQPQAATSSTTTELRATVLGLLGAVATVDLTTTGTGVQTVSGSFSNFFADAAQNAVDPPYELGDTVHNGNTTVGLGGLAYGSTNLTVSLLGLGLVTVAVSGTSLANALSPVLSPLDTQVIGPLVRLLGLNVGSADTTGVDMSCTAPRLVK